METIKTSRNVSPQWVKHLLDCAEQSGACRKELLESTGLNEPDSQRISLDQTVLLWREAVKATGDEYFGLHMGQKIHPGVLNRISHLMLSSDSLLTALEKSRAYLRLVSDGGELLPLENKDWIELEYQPRMASLEFSHHQIEAVLAGIVQILHWLAGEKINPVSVSFTHSQQANTGVYKDFFACPVNFGAKKNSICFPPALKNIKLPSADPELFALHDAMAQRLLKQLKNSSWAERTRQLLASRLALGPQASTNITKAAIAGQLDTSARTLQRRLKDEGESFQSILDSLRRDLAKQYLRDRQLSIEEIGHLLGFSDSRNFYRTFKRWWGITPREWRLNQAN